MLWRPWIPGMQYTAYSILHMLLFRLWYTASGINTVFGLIHLVLFILSLHFGDPDMILLSELNPRVEAPEIGFYQVPALFILKHQSKVPTIVFFFQRSSNVDQWWGIFTPWWSVIPHHGIHQASHLLERLPRGVVSPGWGPVCDLARYDFSNQVSPLCCSPSPGRCHSPHRSDL